MCTKYISVIHFLFLNININLNLFYFEDIQLDFMKQIVLTGDQFFFIYLSNVGSHLWVIELVSSRLKVWIILKICIQLQITIFDIITAVPRCAHTSPPTFFFCAGMFDPSRTWCRAGMNFYSCTTYSWFHGVFWHCTMSHLCPMWLVSVVWAAAISRVGTTEQD